MKLHPKLHSQKFQFFYEAFAFKTYGKSMGRAADTAAVEFKTLYWTYVKKQSKN